MTFNSNSFVNFFKRSNSDANQSAAINILPQILIKLYQATFAHFLGGRCRYYPSCSHYAVEAYEKFTFFRATQLVFVRFISCHPLSKKPFYDPVPINERAS